MHVQASGARCQQCSQTFILCDGKKVLPQERGERTDKNQAEPAKTINGTHTFSLLATLFSVGPISELLFVRNGWRNANISTDN